MAIKFLKFVCKVSARSIVSFYIPVKKERGKKMKKAGKLIVLGMIAMGVLSACGTKDEPN